MVAPEMAGLLGMLWFTNVHGGYSKSGPRGFGTQLSALLAHRSGWSPSVSAVFFGLPRKAQEALVAKTIPTPWFGMFGHRGMVLMLTPY